MLCPSSSFSQRDPTSTKWQETDKPSINFQSAQALHKSRAKVPWFQDSLEAFGIFLKHCGQCWGNSSVTQCGDLGSDPQRPLREPGVAVLSSNPSAGERADRDR